MHSQGSLCRNLWPLDSMKNKSKITKAYDFYFCYEKVIIPYQDRVNTKSLPKVEAMEQIHCRDL